MRGTVVGLLESLLLLNSFYYLPSAKINDFPFPCFLSEQLLCKEIKSVTEPKKGPGSRKNGYAVYPGIDCLRWVIDGRK